MAFSHFRNSEMLCLRIDPNMRPAEGVKWGLGFSSVKKKRLLGSQLLGLFTTPVNALQIVFEVIDA